MTETTPPFNTLNGWLAWQEELHFSEIDLGLARTQKVLAKLDIVDRLPFCITVAGTNGKGSSIASMAAILTAAGKRVGTYTSPHIERYNERIKIDHADASDADICAAFAAINSARGDISLTYFEFGTLAALWIFAHADIDVMLLEVGLGGRLDAVNVIDADIALISGVGLDHVDWLGATVDEIAPEKLGICRRGKPAVWSSLEVPKSVLPLATEQGWNIDFAGDVFRIEQSPNALWWHSKFGSVDLTCLQRLPTHFIRNIAGALQALCYYDRSVVFAINFAELATKLLPAGRCEVWPEQSNIVLDVAHNEQSASALCDWLRRQYPQHHIVAIVGILKRKEPTAIIKSMLQCVDEYWVTQFESEACWELAQLESEVLNLQAKLPVSKYKCIADTLTQLSLDENTLYVVFGSFYAVSEFKAAWKNRMKKG